MDTLPWPIVYGPWIWKGAVVILVALTLLVRWLKPRLTLHRRAKRELARLGEPKAVETATAGGSVTLSGILKISGEPILRFEDGKPAAATTAAPSVPSEVLGALAITRCAEGLTLDVGGQEVGIEGDLEVLVGSREFFHGRPFGKVGRQISADLYTVDNETLEAIATHRAAFRSLQPGDRVRVRGFLRRLNAPSTSEGYRVAADRWVLSAQPEVDSTEVLERTVGAAYEGRPRVAVFTPRTLIRSVLVTAILGTVALTALGIALRMSGGNPYYADSTYIGPEQGFCLGNPFPPVMLISSTLPLSYTWEMESFGWRLDEQCFWDRGKARQLAAAWGAQGHCGREALALVNHGELDRGAEVASGCDNPRELRETLEALFILGHFEEASDLAQERLLLHQLHGSIRWDFILTIHLLANRPERAAAAARAKADQHMRQSRDDPYNPQSFVNKARTARCLADWVEGRQGDAEALERLRQEAEAHWGSDYCGVLAADLFQGEERLVPIRIRTPTHPLFQMELLLTAEVAPDALPRGPYSELSSTLNMHPNTMLRSGFEFDGLAQAALTRLEAIEAPSPEAARLRAELRTRASRYALIMGDLDEARRLVRATLADLEMVGAEARQDRFRGSWIQIAQARLAFLEVEAGDLDRANELIDQLRRIPDVAEGQPSPERLDMQIDAYIHFRESSEARVLDLTGYIRSLDIINGPWSAVAAGGGERLALFFTGRYSRFRGSFRPVWLRHIRTGRELLARQVRWSNRSRSYQLRVGQILADHVWDLQVARGLGDDEWAHQLEPLVERFRQAQMRRDIALPLMVLER